MIDIKKHAGELNTKLKEFHDKHQAIPENALYHYTSFKGLEGILKSKQLWLTDHKFLNDPSEIEHSKLLILNHIESNIKNNNQLSDFMKFFFNDIIVRGYKTFITSLCKEGDYLPAWRYYGNDGAGFSIGFKKEYFQPSQQADKRTSSMVFKVEYAEQTAHQVSKIFSIADSVFADWINQNSSDLEPFLDVLFAALITITPSIKHPDYSTEQEWRFCLPRIYFEKTNSWYPYELPIDQLYIDHVGTSQIIPFIKNIKTSIPRLKTNTFGYCDIETIYVGPRLDYMTAKIAIEKMLLDAGISTSELKAITIKESTRPYQ